MIPITRNWFRVGVALVALLLSFSAWAEVSLPRLVSDGMVLQRDQELTLWGWADPGESVQLTFRGSTYRSEADAEGHWHRAA